MRTALFALTCFLWACDQSTEPLPLAEELPHTVRPPRFAASGVITIGSLGTLGSGPLHVANAINNRGQVIGASSLANGDVRAFFWIPSGGMVAIGTLGGAMSQANAINDSGMVVGVSTTGTGIRTAFRWQVGRPITSLGTFGGVESRATGINNRGDVVGSYMPNAFNPMNPGAWRGTQGFLQVSSGGFRELPTLGSPVANFPRAINDSGRVVGLSNFTANPAEPLVAYTWTSTGGIRSLGSLGGAFTEHVVFAVNGRGVATGGAFDSSSLLFRPFVWTPGGGLVDLTSHGFPTTLSAIGLDINVLGQVAMLVLEPSGVRTLAVWLPGSGLYRLPTLGGSDGEVWGINDIGEIVGWSLTGSGAMRPALWRLQFAAEDRVDDVVTVINDLLAGSLPAAADKELESALKQLDKAEQALARTPPDLDKAAKEIADAIKEIRQAIADGLDATVGVDLQQVLCQAARDLLTDAIDAAVARGGDPSDIAKARNHLATGDSLRDAGLYERAADEYAAGIKDAQKA